MAGPPPEDLSRDKLLATLRRDADGRPVLGDYTLLRRLGVGGMGAVYYGLHPRLKREVAIKILPFHLVDQEPDLVKRFLAEARMAASLESDHVVQVLDVGEDHGTHYFVMQYVSGESAGAYLKRRKAAKGGIPEREALEIVRAATKGLSLAHSRGIIHRDIKPDNIMIPTGKLERSKITDLGLAKPEKSGHSFGTMSHVAMGTPGYMAPEQAEDAKSASAASDVFAMGATLYALLAGRQPFAGTSLMAVMRKAAEEEPDPLPETISPGVRNLVLRCLEKDPQQRYENGAELLEALEHVLRDPTTTPKPKNAPEKPRPKPKYKLPAPPPEPPAKPWPWIAAAAGVAVVAIVVVAMMMKKGSPEEPAKPSPVAVAREKLSKQDLDGALAALAGVSGEEARGLRDEVERRLREKKERDAEAARELQIRALLQEAADLEKAGRLDDALGAIRRAEAIESNNYAVRQAKLRVEGALADARALDDRRRAFKTFMEAAEGARKTAEAQDSFANWQRVIEILAKAQQTAPTEEEKREAGRAGVVAIRRRAWARAKECEAAGRIEEALVAVDRAIATGEAPAELLAYKDALQKKRGGSDMKAARKKAFDELAAKASAEADPAKAVELWSGAADLADDPKDQAAARAKADELTARLNAEDVEQKAAALVKQGDEAVAAAQLDLATEKYKEALKLKPGEGAATAGLKKVDAARMTKAYESAMAEGKAAEQQRWWDDAKAAYEKALAAKPGDAAAKKEIADVEKQRKASRVSVALDDSGRVKMEFVLVKAGTFTMGQKEGESDETPHEVTLTKDFWIGVTEVTQAQWEAVMGRDKNPSFIKGADLPANNFNWDEANGFIKRLNIRFKADRAALPTEAEWEYACRAGTRTPYIWGAESEAVNLHAWHEGNSGGELKSVAQKKANGWGLYDMAGNAWEWCADAPRQYKDKIVDPFGSVKDRGDRCVRGGSALEHPHLTRSGNRHGCNAGERFKNVGLRVVMH